MIAIPLESKERYTVCEIVEEINESLHESMLTKFSFYRAKGIILNQSFDEDCWKLTDEVFTVTIHFDVLQFDEPALMRTVGITQKWLINKIKLYVLMKLGVLKLHSLSNIPGSIAKFLTAMLDGQSILKASEGNLAIIQEFWDLLPRSDGIESIQEMLDDIPLSNSRSYNRRALAPFMSYFRFSSVLKTFWDDITDEAFIHYFPLWLWWNISTILPLRVTEFTLTPRNCLEKTNSGYTLTIRRTKGKKHNDILHYKLETDYKIQSYPIPDSLAQEIEKYLVLTAEYPDNECNCLFRYPNKSKLLTSSALRKLLTEFYNKVISKEYRIVPKGTELAENEITCIQPGDTRHLAMISIILQGGNPVVCKQLADHEDINISSHYYNNISELVRCATYEVLRLKRTGTSSVTFQPRYFERKYVEMHDGRCYSQNYQNGNVDDCLKAWSDDQMGTCLQCPYFVKHGSSFSLNLQVASAGKTLDKDYAFLKHLIEQVKKRRAAPPDIDRALLNLQSRTREYQNLLLEQELQHGSQKEILR